LIGEFVPDATSIGFLVNPENPTGRLPGGVLKIIGIVAVAAFAARAAGSLSATMSATCRRTNSSAKQAAFRVYVGPAMFNKDILIFGNNGRFQSAPKMAVEFAQNQPVMSFLKSRSSDIGGWLLRAASIGHATAPPSSVMNSSRLIIR
jgi:hypothetical protein